MNVRVWGALLTAAPLMLFATGAGAQDSAGAGGINVTAVIMFLIFVAATLYITYWASQRTKTASDFYAAGGGLSGFQNGLAIAGDYMSAASFLGISGLVFLSGYDGLIYSVGWLVGWPIIMFLIAEQLRNLGKYTFADVASYRLQQTPIRTVAATGTLVVVILYLIGQMVGAGKLIQLLFGLPYIWAVIIVGVLIIIYVTFGGMLATSWVQMIKACLLLGGATFIAGLALWQFGFNPGTMFREAVAAHSQGIAIMGPGTLVTNPLDAISLGIALMFGTAGLPHILMRFFTVPNATEARKSVFYATGFIGYFYILTFIIGFGAITLVMTNPSFLDQEGVLLGGNNMAAMHLANAVGGSLFLGFISAVAFATILAVIRTGKQALTQIAPVGAGRPLKRVPGFSPNPGHRASSIQRLQAQGFEFAVTNAESVAQAVDGAMIITLVTRATQAFLSAAMVSPGAHINAVGAIVPSRVEFAQDVLPRCGRIGVDSLPQVQKLSRELMDYFGTDKERWQDVIPLSTLVAERRTRAPETDLTLFKAMGMGISDLSLGTELYRRARARNIGRGFAQPQRAKPRLHAKMDTKGESVKTRRLP